MKNILQLNLEKIVGGGQAIGTLPDGRKAFVWSGLPGETVEMTITKKKSKLVEGVVTNVIAPSAERITPIDPDSFLSTSPWQMMNFAAEQRYKAQLIDEAFELHNVSLPDTTTVYTDNEITKYRNKVEFSWYGTTNDDGTESLDLAFFRRGSKGKIIVNQCSLLPEPMMQLALQVRDLLQDQSISARQLKTLLIRCNQAGDCVFQLYVKDLTPDWKTILHHIFNISGARPWKGGEVIYSDPRSPASRITERLAQVGDIVLQDSILGTAFRYATEGFFQVNIPVYEQALLDMKHWIPENTATIDMYSGVGTIGLTIGGPQCTLVEIDENAVREMRRNITDMKSTAQAVLAPSEKALEHITGKEIMIVDPPRAGLHADVIARLLETRPSRIIYLSCNPVTQARDVGLLLETYKITHHQGYNFFPRTPHIEHLVVLDV